MGLDQWTPLGPGNIGGRTLAVLVDPTNPLIMYAAGAAGGVWKSTDGGASWNALTDSIANMAISSLAMDPQNHLVIYAGTGEGDYNVDAMPGSGIFVTRDGGASWTQMPTLIVQYGVTPQYFTYVNQLVVSPNNSLNLYVAADTGIWRSLDGGVTWTRQVLSYQPACYSVAIRTDQPTDYVVAGCSVGVSGGIYVNPDAAGAGNWDNTLWAAAMGRTSLAIAPSSQNIMYALAANNGLASCPNGASSCANSLLAVYRSMDGGYTWNAQVNAATAPTLLNTLLLSDPYLAACQNTYNNLGWYDNVIAVDPADPTKVWVGGVDLFRSDDSGHTWGLASYSWPLPPSYPPQYVHANQHAIVFHPQYDGATNTTMFVGSDGGVFMTPTARAATSTNACAVSGPMAWTSLDNGYAVTQFYSGVPYPGGATYIGGTINNGTIRGSDAGGPNAWTTLLTGDAGQVLLDPTNSNNIYVAGSYGSINKSADGGNTWIPAALSLGDTDNFSFLTPLAMDPSNPQTLWTGGGLALWLSTNGGAAWTQASPSYGLSGYITAIAVAPTNSNIVLVGDANGAIYRSSSALASNVSTVWAAVTPQYGAYVSSLAFDPVNSNIAYATFSNYAPVQVMTSTDFGATWNPIIGSGNTAIPDIPVHTLVVDPNNTQVLYIGTDLGVLVSPDQGQTWNVESTGFPLTVTESLAIGNVGGVPNIFAFTHGRGAWRVPTADVATNRLTVTKNGTGTGTVTSSPSGIACGPTCSASFTSNSLVTLSAAADTGYAFGGWSGGGCSGVGTCTVTMSADTSVNAVFGTNPVPVLGSLFPNPVIAGGPGFTLSAYGTNFQAGSSVVQINGSTRGTTFVSSGQMTATILASDIATAGTPNITVFTPPPGGGTSNAIALDISASAPPPVMGYIAPNSIAAGTAGAGVTVYGNSFSVNSVVQVNGSARPTTFLSGTQLSAPLLAGDVASAGPLSITVFTPAPGGGTSASQTLTVTPAAPPGIPGFTGITPGTVAAGGPGFTLTASGFYFVSNSVVQVNGVARATTFVSGGQLTAAILASDIASPGSLTITIFNPGTGGGISITKTLTVVGPSIAVSETTAPPGAVVGATVSYPPGGAQDILALASVGAPVTSVLQSVLVNSLSGSPKSWPITMPTTNGQYEFRLLLNGTYTLAATSPTVTVSNSNPVPIFGNGIFVPAPGVCYAGSSSCTLYVTAANTVTGTIVPSTVLMVNGSPRPTVYLGPFNLSGTILASDIATAGNINFSLYTPPPGGGTSFTYSSTITAPPGPPVLSSIVPATVSSGGGSFILSAVGSNFAPNSVLMVNGSPRQRFSGGSSAFDATILPSDIANVGTPAITIFTPAPGGGTSAPVLLNVVQGTPVPVLNGISPSTVPAGSPNFTLTLNGSGFTPNSVVQIAGSARVTTYVSANQLTATILASDVVAASLVTVAVFTQSPGGGLSAGRTLTVNNPPAPVLTSISPTTVVLGTGFTLTATGSNFSTNSYVQVNGVFHPTVFVSSTQLTATFLSTDILAAGTPNITVFTPAPGGGTSAGQTLTVTAPVPILTSINPTSVAPGGYGFALTVNGSSFTLNSVVRVNGVARSTVYVSSIQMNAIILASDIATAGSPTITVFTPSPGGGISAGQTLTVSGPNISVSATQSPPSGPVTATFNSTPNGSTDWVALAVVGSAATSYVQWTYVNTLTGNPKAWNLTMPTMLGSYEVRYFLNNGYTEAAVSPSITVANINATPAVSSLNPPSVVAGAAAFSLGVTGTGFVNGATATVGGISRAVTFGSATQLSIAVQASDITTQGNVAIVVTNPVSCNGGVCVSNSVNLNVNAPPPAPVLTGISPTTVGAGGANFTLTANGSSFASNSVVRINGTARTTVFVSATQLTATILAADIALGGTPSITVFTPAPGGGTSSGQTLTVSGPNISVSATQSPPGGPITATFNNTPNGANDWVALAVVGSAPSTYAQWAYVNTLTGNPKVWNLTMPTTLGTYEVRYFLNNGYTEAAVSPSITVANINPTPTIAALIPANVVTGAAAFPLTVSGTGYVNGATATVGGMSRTVTFVSATQLNIAIQASDVASQGNAAIVVTNPASCTGGICTSNSVNLSVTAPPPTPVLTSISPTTATAGGSNFSLTANGSNFTANSVVQINGVTRATTYVSATQLTATILAADIANAGTPTITVFTPTPGGGTSSGQTLTVTAPPAPLLTSISPTTVAAGGTSFTLTANGSSFSSSSVVRINGTARATVFVSATQLTATILAADIALGGTPSITVFTPAPGGGTSSGQTLTVSGPNISVSATSSPPSGPITATFNNTPNGSTDWVSLALVGSAPSTYVQWAYVNTLTGNPKAWNLNMPTTLGNYEVRYFLNNGYTEAAVSPTVQVSNLNPTPTISNLNPASMPVNSPPFYLTINGTGFVSGATTTVGFSVPRFTAFVSATQLTVQIFPSDIGSVGNVPIVVTNPAACTTGNCVSNSVNLAVTPTPPAPILTGINPTSIQVGSASLPLTVTGSNFTANSVVQLSGAPLPTVFVNSTTLTATVAAAYLAIQSTPSITVNTPTAGTSAGITFNVTIPPPVIAGLSPASVAAASGAFTLVVNGSGFVTSSSVTVGGQVRGFANAPAATQLSVLVQAADTAAPGNVPIVITDPGPCTGGSCVSATVNLAVTAPSPVPVLTSINPSSANAGGPNFTLTANGSNFAANSVVQVNGSARATVFVSATQLTATITGADIASTGTPTITVFTPAPGGGTSAGQTLNITAPPAPVLTSISPTTVGAGGAGFTLTTNGSNFVANSVVRINGTARATTFVSATQLTATILAADIALGGTPSITVFTPAPGGGTSSGQTLTVSGPNIGVSATSSPPSGPITATFNNTPNGSTDWVSLALVGSAPSIYVQWAYVNTLTGNPKVWNLTMPPTLGNYEVRYFLNNGYTEAAVSPSITVANINATPAISGLTPPSVVAGAAAFSLGVTGSGFVNGATATVGGISRAVTFVSATSLNIAVQASDVASQGNAAVVVTNPTSCTGGNCVSNSMSLSITAPPPAPTIFALAWLADTQYVGGPSFTLDVSGSNFVPTTVVQVNGVARITTYTSSTYLTATILASDIATVGTLNITVYTPPPGGGTSAITQINVVAPPVPVLTSISPATVASGGASFTLTAYGNNFGARSVLQINGVARSTFFAAGTQLSATILASDIASGGTPTITVFTPTPGGGTSAGQTLTVSGPTINVSATTSPPSGPITATFNNTPNGSTDWVSLALVGSPATTYAQWAYVNTLTGNPKVWNLTMPTTLGNYEVRYFLNNGYTEAAVSPSITVANVNATPAISSLNPSSVVAGAAAFSLGVAGTGFVSGATATVGGTSRAVTFVSATSLNIAVQASDVATQGNAAIVVTNPASCAGSNCVSNSVNLSITAPPPVPVLTSINPNAVLVGGANFTLTANGSGFTANSVVQVNGIARTTVYVSANLLTATILSTDVSYEAQQVITVFTPAPGGGTSSGQVLTVYSPTSIISSLNPSSIAAGSGNTWVAITGTGFVFGSVGNVNGIPHSGTQPSSTQLNVLVGASDLASIGNLAITVSSPPPCNGGNCVSNSLNLNVTAPPPAPVLASINPSSATAGGPNITITASGSNFTASSVVQINGLARATAYVSATQLTATILAGDIVTAATPTITVFTPAPGGGTSGGQTLTVTAPVGPTIGISTAGPGSGGAETATLMNTPNGSTDWVALAVVGAPATSYLQWAYVYTLGGSPKTWSITMPTASGQYEIRYFLNNGYTEAVVSPTITIP